MTEISEAAKAKACELANAERVTSSSSGPFIPADCLNSPSIFALARFIQEVSDAAKGVDTLLDLGRQDEDTKNARAILAPFILPEPVDPLLIEARKIAARARRTASNNGLCTIARRIESGEWDDHQLVLVALDSLRRGLEIVAKEQSK